MKEFLFPNYEATRADMQNAAKRIGERLKAGRALKPLVQEDLATFEYTLQDPDIVDRLPQYRLRADTDVLMDVHHERGNELIRLRGLVDPTSVDQSTIPQGLDPNTMEISVTVSRKYQRTHTGKPIGPISITQETQVIERADGALSITPFSPASMKDYIRK